MKIFSLKSKWNLVGWSVGLSAIYNLLALWLSGTERYESIGSPMLAAGRMVNYNYGWPFSLVRIVKSPLPWLDDVSYKINYLSFLFNFIFWILVVFIILSLIRYFKSKKV